MQLNLAITHSFTDPAVFAAFATDFAALAAKFPDVFADNDFDDVADVSDEATPPATTRPRKGPGRPRGSRKAKEETPTVADKVTPVAPAPAAVEAVAPATSPAPPPPSAPAPAQAPVQQTSMPLSAPAAKVGANTLRDAFMECVGVIGNERMLTEVLKGRLGVTSPSALPEERWAEAVQVFAEFVAAGK